MLQGAVGSPLDTQFVRRDALPKEGGVPRQRGAHHGVGIQILGHGRRNLFSLARLEFQYAPGHLGDILVTDTPGDVLVDEPALTERSLFGADHVAHLGGNADLLSRP